MDIEAILQDQVSHAAAQNRPPFASSFDYSAFQQARDAALQEWKGLGREGQARYKSDLRTFYKEKSLLPEENQEFANAKNFFLLNKEVAARIGSKSNLDLIIINDLNYPAPAVELLENAENSDHIRDLYKVRKRTTGTEKKLWDCFG